MQARNLSASPAWSEQEHVANLWSEAEFTQLVNEAFKSYHSVLALARSPLANSPLVAPLLVLDDVSPTADERGQALRLVLQWAVNRLAPSRSPYPPGSYRPADDPAWRDPRWWRYNILRYRYLEPLHPDEFVEGGRFTETLLALTGIPSPDTFFDERNRAIREVAQWLWQQMASGQATGELQRLALESVSQLLRTRPASAALLDIAATFRDVFPRSLLLQMAATEHITQAESALDYVIRHRFLLQGDAGQNLWMSPVLRAYLYQRQPQTRLHTRHRRVAAYYRDAHDALKAARHLQQAHDWSEAASILMDAVVELVNELQVDELCQTLDQFRSTQLPPAQWREIQLLLSDLYNKSGRHEKALAACRQALRATDEAAHQARIYRRMGKLYEKHNQLHALGYYQQAVERFTVDDPEFVELLKDRAWLYILRQEWQNAQADLAIALGHISPTAYALRADIDDAWASLHRHQKQYAQAIRHAATCLESA